MRPRTALTLASLLLGLAGAPAPGAAQDELVGPPPPPTLELSELRADPASHVGQPLRFRVQIDAEREHWNPWLTRFGTQSFRSWSGWSDDRMPWVREVWSNPSKHLYARRESAAARTLGGARRHERYEVEAVVREVFLGEPWIEITSARRLPHMIGEGSVLHASRALALMEQGSWVLARNELERASTSLLPEHALEVLDALLEEIALHQPTPVDVEGEAD